MTLYFIVWIVDCNYCIDNYLGIMEDVFDYVDISEGIFYHVVISDSVC